MPVKTVAFVSVKVGREDAFIAAARTCIATSRNEIGVLRFDLWRETEGDRRFVFDELYVDDAAVAQHMASDHLKAFVALLGDLASAPPVLIGTRRRFDGYRRPPGSFTVRYIADQPRQ